MAKVLGPVVSVLVGALLAVVVVYATVATLRPDAKQENLQTSSEVTQAGGDVSRVILRYGSR